MSMATPVHLPAWEPRKVRRKKDTIVPRGVAELNIRTCLLISNRERGVFIRYDPSAKAAGAKNRINEHLLQVTGKFTNICG